MISSDSLSRKWAFKFKEKPGYETIDPGLLNKMIYALVLLEYLKLGEVPFTLKGGTALILLLKKPRRFSIDIDIVTPETKNNLEKTFSEIIKHSPFSDVKEDIRKTSVNIPKLHYKFFYDSDFQEEPAYILLDILNTSFEYPVTTNLTLDSEWLKTKGAITEIKSPTINAIAGDKLTAFAPNTIGVPYGKNKSLQIIKQLFDLGLLFNKINDFSIVMKSFSSIAKIEISYRKNKFTTNKIIEDIINTGLLIAQRTKFKNPGEEEKFKELNSGITKLKSYLISGKFRIDEAIESSAKAAYLAAKIQEGNTSPIKIMKENEKMQHYLIKNPDFNFLNKLKNLPNNALVHWHSTLKTLNKI